MRVIIAFIMVELIKIGCGYGVYFGNKVLCLTGIIPAEAEITMREAQIYGNYVGWAVLFGCIAVWFYNCFCNPDFEAPAFFSAKSDD